MENSTFPVFYSSIEELDCMLRPKTDKKEFKNEKVIYKSESHRVNANDAGVNMWIARHKLRQELSGGGCAFPG